MNKICGIYKIISPSGKIYIGQSKDINKRKFTYSRKNCKGQYKLYNSIIKYGWENHNFEIICKCDVGELNKKEIFYIKEYNSFNTEHGLNLNSGGKNNIPTEETRKKMSNLMKGNKIWLNRKHTKETKNKMSCSAKGRIFSKETKLKMSIAAKNKKISKETINKFKNRIFSKETKLKMSNSKKGIIPTNCKKPANHYKIFNENNELVYEFNENFIKKTKILGLPTYSLIESHTKNIKIPKGKYKNWYAIKS